MELHVFFYTKNLFQIRKSYLEVRADTVVRNFVRKLAILIANNKFEKTDAILNTFEDQDNNSDDDEISHNVDELDIIREESLINSVKITLTQFLASNSKSVYYINVFSGLMNTSLAWNSDQIEANFSLFYC